MSITDALTRDPHVSSAPARPNREDLGLDARPVARHDNPSSEQRHVAAIAKQVAAECEALMQLTRALSAEEAGLEEAREQAAAAIRAAEARAATSMRAAQELVKYARADARAQLDELREELERERAVADEATRRTWRAERELLLATRPATDLRPAPDDEPLAGEPSGRRSPRVRVRLVS